MKLLSKDSNTATAVIWMMMALVGFSLLAVASRELTMQMGTLDILFWRSLIGFTLISLLLLKSGVRSVADLQLNLLGWHMLRNTAHFAGQCAWLMAIAVLPLAEVFALEFTTPLWAALLAALFLGEALNRGRWISLLLGLAGVLVILRPGAAVINPVSLIMLAGALGFGVNVIITRKLTMLLDGHPQTYLLILFFMTGMQGLFSLVALQSNVSLPVSELWPWLAVAAVTALAAHYCLSRALSLADAAVVMPIDYLRLPLIMLVAWWLYGEVVSLSLMIGAGLIVAANAVGLYIETSRVKRQATGLNPKG
jgi:drug/metabolite transporter (DMT)-like permease